MAITLDELATIYGNQGELQYILSLIDQAAQERSMDRYLPLALVYQESKFNPEAVSTKGARGLFQLMPTTAKQYNVNPSIMQENITGGMQYLGDLLDRYGGDVPKALAAYNVGPTAMRRREQRGRPLPLETRSYVKNVMDLRNFLQYFSTPGYPGQPPLDFSRPLVPRTLMDYLNLVR